MFHPQHCVSHDCCRRCCSPPEKGSSPGSLSANLFLKKQRETSDTPIMRALKELSEEKIFKNWGTQTEKEDTPHSKCSVPCLVDTQVIDV